MDGIPLSWEYNWEYDPFSFNNHAEIDLDSDSLTNIEEYLTSSWGSDPFRQDIFLEIDYMAEGPNGESHIVNNDAQEILKNPFHKRNIAFHVDDGENNGGEFFEFSDTLSHQEILDVYQNYFIHNDTNVWKRSVFHYTMIVNHCKPNGYAFIGEGKPFSGFGYGPGTNGMVISARSMENSATRHEKSLDYIYASAIMHEMGHNFGLRAGNPPGVDVHRGIYPWQPLFWLFLNYRSIMNYIYTYAILDYSDGTNGWLDHNDWGKIDLTYFEPR
ncbi:MAG: hypothetical protein JSW62_01220 [Thermoplasmatales archaeon]|nr:MAG: hypothetical protein JSW62_01220 [Thermoplasmatales archaeon]